MTTFSSPEELRSKLPKVGDELVLVPTLHKGLGNSVTRPHRCVVEYVNEKNLWYKVRFDFGVCECFYAFEGGVRHESD